jgi:transcriptional regulator with XRE-family HTH domain/tetratricopeptide (TPR) repeat protein
MAVWRSGEGFCAMAAGDPGRNCSGCGLPLSRYNTEPCCQACISAGRNTNPARRAKAGETLVDGARLAQVRREHGWTQELLAGRAGVSTELVRKLEQGAKRSARLSSLAALAGTLGVSVSALLSGDPAGGPASEPARPTDRARQSGQAREPGQPTLLRALIAKRHWQNFRTFEAQFRRTARELAERERDPGLAKLTVSSRQWERWYSGNVKTEPYPDACRVLEHMFGRPIQRLLAPVSQESVYEEVDRAASDEPLFTGSRDPARYPGTTRLSGPEHARVPCRDVPGDTVLLADQISELANWVETTNVGDGTIAYLDDATLRLAKDCLTDPPARSYERAAALARRIFDLLKGGHQRIGQTRDLYVIAGKLCAVLSWMSSDLGQLAAAEAHTRNGWVLADEADHDGLRALLHCAQSKNAFWDKRYDDAAMHARRGCEYKPPGSAHVLLACQEADALQAQGRIDDAREALKRAERAQETIRQADELGGIFACGIARQANYAAGTCLRAGAVKEALRHVERAEAAWRDGEQWAYGTWAQVQTGAAIAHVMNGEVDGAAAVLQPVLNEPAERHLATVTTRLRNDVIPLLETSAIGRSRDATSLHEQITDYCEARSVLRMLPAGGDR